MTHDTIRSALFAIPPDDRDLWFRMASALKRELGEVDGFALWREWSRQWPRYSEADALRTWRSAARENGAARPVTIGSLYYYARQWGWKGETEPRRRLPAEERAAFERQRELERERIVRGQGRAARRAQAMLNASRMEPHPYLENKGLGNTYGHVLGENLLVPIRDPRNDELWAVQVIAPDGDKRFLSRARAAGLVHQLGTGAGVRFYCEGYATALSIRAALRRLGRLEDSVVACLSAANVAAVAERRGRRTRDLVVADRDAHSCASRSCAARWHAPWGADECPDCHSRWVVQPVGERYARETPLRYWLPPEPGDANDLMLANGLDALAESLSDFIGSAW